MTARFRLSFILAMAGLNQTLAAPVADFKKIEADVAQLDASRVEALLSLDLQRLERLYAENMVYIHASGRIDAKASYLAILAAGNLSYVTLRYEPAPTVRVVGPDTAVVTGQATVESKNKSGQLTKRLLTTTTVYVRSADGWRVVSYQGTPVQP